MLPRGRSGNQRRPAAAAGARDNQNTTGREPTEAAMREGSFTAWKDKMLFWGATALVTAIAGGGVSWSAWATLRIVEIVPKAEIQEMIESDAPYVQDRKAIQAQLSRLEKTESKLTQVIDRNTEAINALRVELAKIK